jgi:hypothetical protein
MRIRLGLPAVVRTALGLVGPAPADPIVPVVGTVTPLSDGQYRYDYTVTNTDTRADHVHVYDPATGQWILDPVTHQPVTGANYEFGSRLVQFLVAFGSLTPTRSVVSPPGFLNNGQGGGWGAIDSYGPDLPGVGQTVHFSFVSPNPPGMDFWRVDYEYFGGNDGFIGARFTIDDQVGPANITFGSVVGPAPSVTPEPTSGVLMGVGVLALAAVHRLRRALVARLTTRA